MKTEWEPVLRDVISEVLETMFFAMVDFEGTPQGNLASGYESEIQLHNHQGRVVISLRVTDNFARMITANFLGVEEDQVSTDDLEDSMRELANMVGGGYHAHVHKMDWELGIPITRRIGPDITESANPDLTLLFGCFGEPAGSADLNYVPN